MIRNLWPIWIMFFFMFSFVPSLKLIIFCIVLLFLIFKPINYCFEKTMGHDLKVSFASRLVSRLIRWYNKPGDTTKEFREKAIHFYGTFHGLKITNWYCNTVLLISSVGTLCLSLLNLCCDFNIYLLFIMNFLSFF